MPRPRGQQPPGAGQTLPSDYWRDAVQRETLIRQRHGLFLDSRTADDSWYGVPDSFRVSASPIGMGLMVRGLCGPSEHRRAAARSRGPPARPAACRPRPRARRCCGSSPRSCAPRPCGTSCRAFGRQKLRRVQHDLAAAVAAAAGSTPCARQGRVVTRSFSLALRLSTELESRTRRAHCERRSSGSPCAL
ncbi:unnamed protein product [Prorocentrum cordatum]|uniref:Uncharacterized protein n=1 Tax=Prorocentrum cordatum TaxID=2364126 RepID=A0ABN9VYP9_9DINO|nr:unnamed protein product [Polarella glacialis]